LCGTCHSKGKRPIGQYLPRILRKQIVHPVNFIVGNAGDYIGKPSLRVDTIQLCGFYQGVSDGDYFFTNPLEGLNKENQRRTNVVGIFPNVSAIRRLVCALMLEK
jgi:hypothetical protein